MGDSLSCIEKGFGIAIDVPVLDTLSGTENGLLIIVVPVARELITHIREINVGEAGHPASRKCRRIPLATVIGSCVIPMEELVGLDAKVIRLVNVQVTVDGAEAAFIDSILVGKAGRRSIKSMGGSIRVISEGSLKLIGIDNLIKIVQSAELVVSTV